MRKLESLQQQSLTPEAFEWIVCVNGSTDGSLEALQVKTAFKLKVIPFSTNKGPSRGRNACIKEAKGQFLYLSDDDCLLAPQTLEQHLTRQKKQAGVVVIGAIQFEAGNKSLWQPEKVNYWNLNGANTSFPKALFNAIGGFDERLTHYGGEDILLGYNLKQQGSSFVAAPEALTHHIGPNPMLGKDLNKAYSAGKNAALIARQYPKLAYRLGVHPALMLAKRWALREPFGRLWKLINQDSFAYEYAYFEGARAEQNSLRKETL
jgi:glycosyltransferase involved in cell wall biosynthesis